MRIGRAKDEDEMKYKQSINLPERKFEECKSQLYHAREDEIRYKSKISVIEERLKEVKARNYKSKVEGGIIMQIRNSQRKRDETRSAESFQSLIPSNYKRFNEKLG